MAAPKSTTEQKRPSFYIIDGHAQIYRAYHAPFRDLTSPTGEPTKGTFVFTQMLINLVELRKPDYLLMVIDASDETVFRKEIFPEYKANRPPKPDDFKPQEDRILQIVHDAGVPILKHDGYEADDIIATLADRLRDLHDVYLVSKDKDLRQLLCDRVVMYDVHTDEEFDAEAMRKKLDYGPEQAVEVQALMGDNIDNVPGVPGIGEKTAAKLINKYGSAAAVFENADQLTPKQSERVKEHGAEKLELSKTLVALKRDLELPEFDEAACKFETLATPALRGHLEELGFKRLLEKIDDGPVEKPDMPKVEAAPRKYAPLSEASLFDPQPDADEKPATRYHLVTDLDDLKSRISNLKSAQRFAFDTETDGLGAMSADLAGMSFSTEAGEGWYVAVKGMGDAVLPKDDVIAAVKPVLEDPRLKKVGHNIKYDVLAMRRVGVDVRGIETDTMVAAFLLDAAHNSYSLDRLATDLLGEMMTPISDLIGKGKKQISICDVPLDRVADYAAEDADMTLRLAELLLPKLDEFPEIRKLHDHVEVPLIDVLTEMEFNGITVDADVLAKQSEVLGARIDDLEQKIYTEAGKPFNIGSPKQLQEILFTDLGLKPVRKTKTGYSTDAAVLEQLASDHTVPALILEYRQLEKLKSTYLDALGNDINKHTGRIHTSFNPTGAATGRLSSSDPNLQNIPIRTEEGALIRSAFVPGGGDEVLLACDYSQIELRMLAHYCEEPRLIEAFANDEDIHRAVAADVFDTKLDDVTPKQRGLAKTINFAIIYGVSAFGLARRIEDLSQKQAQETIDTYKQRFPKIFEFFDQCIADAKEHGYVETIKGRRRPIPEIESRIVSMRQYAERTAINSVIQGSAADLIKIAMVDLHAAMTKAKSKSKLLLQVHDELVLECPKDVVEVEASLVCNAMENAMGLRVPLKVDANWAPNWQDAK
ncbi:MAG: DNA polymerase I [Planctomycetota bacterium]